MKLLMKCFFVFVYSIRVFGFSEGLDNQSRKVQGLLGVGDFLELVQDVNLRDVRTRKVIRPLLKGSVYQILGVKITKKGRYYLVSNKKKLGFIYGGDQNSYKKWTKQTWNTEGLEKILAQPGDYIQIKRDGGAVLLKSVKSSKRSEDSEVIPNETSIVVAGIKADKRGRLFYKVKYRAYSGYIEVGSIASIQKKVSSNSKWASFE